jgi:hypothetical protein
MGKQPSKWTPPAEDEVIDQKPVMKAWTPPAEDEVVEPLKKKDLTVSETSSSAGTTQVGSDVSQEPGPKAKQPSGKSTESNWFTDLGETLAAFPTAVVKGAVAAFGDMLPGMVAAGEAGLAKNDFENVIINQSYPTVSTPQGPVKQNVTDDMKKAAVQNYISKVGEQQYTVEKDAYELSQLRRRSDLLKYSDEQDIERQETLGDTPQTTGQIKDIKTALAWLGGAGGNAIGTAPAMIAGPVFPFLMEKGEAYKEGLKKIQETTGLSRDEILALDLDKAARENSDISGAINTGLELAGNLAVFGRFIPKGIATKFIAKAFTSKFGAPVVAAMGEGVTEGIQAMDTELAAMMATGKYKDVFEAANAIPPEKWEEIRQEAYTGAAGGTVISAGGGLIEAQNRATRLADIKNQRAAKAPVIQEVKSTIKSSDDEVGLQMAADEIVKNVNEGTTPVPTTPEPIQPAASETQQVVTPAVQESTTPVGQGETETAATVLEKTSGTFYRVDTGMTQSRNATAKDIVDFEADELGNEDVQIGREKAKELGIDLSQYSHKDIVWVTKSKEDAERYGAPEDVQEVPIENGTIIAEDGDGGFLILKDKLVTKETPSTPVTETPDVLTVGTNYQKVNDKWQVKQADGTWVNIVKDNPTPDEKNTELAQLKDLMAQMEAQEPQNLKMSNTEKGNIARTEVLTPRGAVRQFFWGTGRTKGKVLWETKKDNTSSKPRKGIKEEAGIKEGEKEDLKQFIDDKDGLTVDQIAENLTEDYGFEVTRQDVIDVIAHTNPKDWYADHLSETDDYLAGAASRFNEKNELSQKISELETEELAAQETNKQLYENERRVNQGSPTEGTGTPGQGNTGQQGQTSQGRESQTDAGQSIRENGDENKSRQAVEELNSLVLTHVPGLGMGQNQAKGMYLSTEEENRYATEENKPVKVKANIKKPFVSTGNVFYDIQRKIIQARFGKNSIDELTDTEGDLLAEMVNEHFINEGYDSIYFPQSEEQEGELIVFDRNNVEFGPFESDIVKDPVLKRLNKAFLKIGSVIMDNAKQLSDMARKLVEAGGDVQFNQTAGFKTRDGKDIGFQYDTDQVARERFDFSNLKKIGSGSDRDVYDIGDGKVLKVAKTARGLEQNIYEGDGLLAGDVIPKVFERGLNYVVTEAAPRIKADDIIPTYNPETGEQVGTERAGKMLAEIKKFSQKDFDNAKSELQDVIRKYGFGDIFNYNVLWGDFTAQRNWGYLNGMALHTDGGTFGGVQMLTSRKSKADMSDPEFREIYQKSRQLKKQFGDTDKNTRYSFAMPDGSQKQVKRIDADVVNGFYSPLEKVINESKQDKMPAKQWIEKFGKGEEAKWTGLTEWLGQQQGSVSKADIQKFLKDNRIEVVEVVKTDNVEEKIKKYQDEAQKEADAYGLEIDFGSEGEIDVRYPGEGRIDYEEVDTQSNRDYAKKLYGFDEKTALAIKRLHEDNQRFRRSNSVRSDTKYQSYQTPGEKSNYKEVLVTMPGKSSQEPKSKWEYYKDKWGITQEEYENLPKFTQDRMFKDWTQYYDYEKRDNSKKFKSSHFDEPNILVHLRMNTRTDAQGNKVLFLEEVQSDWGQEGKKKGFGSSELTPAEIQEKKEINERTNQAQPVYNKFLDLAQYIYGSFSTAQQLKDLVKLSVQERIKLIEAKYKQVSEDYASMKPREWQNEGFLQKAIDTSKKIYEKQLDTAKQDFDINQFERDNIRWHELTAKQTKQAIPTAPFVTDTNSWTKLGLKVALKEAVKQGADKIAWTTGEQQNERYDLSKQVDEITYSKYDDGTYQFAGSKNDTQLFNYQRIPENRLEDYVGKDVAKKIIDGEGELIKSGNKEEGTYQEFGRTLSGIDLKVGGKGMKGFYGSPTEGSLGIVGNVAKSLFKQEPKVTNLRVSKDKRGLENYQILEGANEAKGTFAIYNEDGIKMTKFMSLDEANQVMSEKYSKDSKQHSITITPELKAQAEQGQPLFRYNDKGEILGFTYNGKIYLNGEKITANTTMEEAGHIWINWTKENRKDLYNAGMNKINKSRYLADVMANENYINEALKQGKKGSKEYNNYLLEEALSKAIADQGAKFVSDSRRNDFKAWVKELWNQIAQAFGIRDLKPSQISGLSLENFARMAAADVFATEKSKQKTTDTKTPGVKAILDRILKSDKTSPAIKKGLQDKGVEYVPKGLDITYNEAKELVELYGDKADLIVRDLTNGLTPDTRTAMTAILYEQYIETKQNDKAIDIALWQAEQSLQAGRASNAAKIWKMITQSGQENIVLAIEKEQQKAIESTVSPVRQELSGTMADIEAEIRKQVEERVQTELEAQIKRKKLITKEKRKEISDFFDSLLIDTSSKGKVYSSVIPGVTLIPEVWNGAVKIMKEAVLIGADVANAIELGLKHIRENQKDPIDENKFKEFMAPKLEAIQPKEPIKREAIDDDKIKVPKLKGKKKKEFIDKVIDAHNEGKLTDKKLEEIYAGKVGTKILDERDRARIRELAGVIDNLEKFEKELEKDFTPENVKKYKELLKDAQKANELLHEFSTTPNKLEDTLISIMQGNLMSTMSLVSNPFYNIALQPLRFLSAIPATFTDSVVTQMAKWGIVGKSLQERTISLPALQKGYFKGAWNGLIEGAQQLTTGTQADPRTLREIQSNFSPSRAIQRWSEQDRTLAQKANDYVEGTIGWEAEVVFRVLNLGDKPWRRAAEFARAMELASIKGFKGKDLQKFLLIPDPESAQKIKEAGDEATFQQQGEWAKMVQGGITNFLNKVAEIPYIGKPAKVILKSQFPFIKTPWNLVAETIQYAAPPVTFAIGVHQIANGNKRGGSMMIGKAMVGAMIQAVAYQLFIKGLLTGDDDKEEKKRNFQLQGTPPANSINTSALARGLAGQSWDTKDRDIWVSYQKMGVLGVLFDSYTNTYKERQANGEPVLGTDTYFQDMVTSGPKVASSSLDQTFLQGTSTLLEAVKDGGNKKTQNWIIKTSEGLAAILYPNTIATISKATDEYLRDVKDESFWKQVQNVYKAKLFMGSDLPVKVNVWGDLVTGAPEGRSKPMYYLFDPTKFKEISTQDFRYKLYQEFKKDYDPDWLPGSPSREFTIDKVSEKFTPKQYELLSVYVGKERADMTQAYINSDEWERDTTEEKKEELKYIYDTAGKIGRNKMMMDMGYNVMKPGEIAKSRDIQKIERALKKMANRFNLNK